MTYRTAQIVASDEIHAIIAHECPAAYRVQSFAQRTAPKATTRLFTVLKAQGVHWETVYDAENHGRYMLFAYRDLAGRNACWKALSTIRDILAQI
jgi:hypothetical protein